MLRYEAQELLRDVSASELLQRMPLQRFLLAGQRIMLQLEEEGLLRGLLRSARADAVSTTDSRAANSRTADSRTADSRTADSRTADTSTADSGTADAGELLQQLPRHRAKLLLAGQRRMLRYEAQGLL